MGKHLKTILGLALLLCGLMIGGSGLYVLFEPSYYEALARIRVQPESSIAPLDNQPLEYDPYIVKTTFGIILSPLVLSNVVEILDLNEAWGKNLAENKKLTTPETIDLLIKHIGLAPIRHTKLVEIRVSSSSPEEAAKIANQIADSYHKYRLDLARQNKSDPLNAAPVQIVDLAFPPQALSPPDSVRLAGAFIFIVGLLPMFAGLRFF